MDSPADLHQVYVIKPVTYVWTRKSTVAVTIPVISYNINVGEYLLFLLQNSPVSQTTFFILRYNIIAIHMYSYLMFIL